MNILLINPSVNHEIRGPHPLKAKDMGQFPHLGLMYISAVLNKTQEFSIKLIDMALEEIDTTKLMDIICQFKPEVIGITSYTDCLYDIKLILKSLQDMTLETFICMGGPHVELYPEETLRTFPVNCIIKGDGELAFNELCKNIKHQIPWQNINGIGYIQKGNYIQNKPWQITSLDDLPFPEREQSSLKKVQSAVSTNYNITSICSSRGCPFPCTFCNSPYKKYRLRSAENVVSEIKFCYKKYNIQEFFFFDDLFNLNKNRVIDICNEIDKLDFSINWSFRGRISALDEETIIRSKKSGCNRIHFGIEAGTQKMLNCYKKNITLNEISYICNLCQKHKVEVVANFMIGGPHETYADIKETFKFASEIKPDFIEFHVLIPYPYTEIYRNMIANKELATDVWKEFALNPVPNFTPPLIPTTLPEKELFTLLNKAYRNFYLNFWFIFKQLKKIKSFNILKKYIYLACRLLKVTT